MRVSFGLFFDFEPTPKDEQPHRESDTYSVTERLPEESERQDQMVDRLPAPISLRHKEEA